MIALERGGNAGCRVNGTAVPTISVVRGLF
jgi:hypothetical protein